MPLPIEQFIAKAKLSLPDVLYGHVGAERMSFLPVMAYPGGVYVSSTRWVEDVISKNEEAKTSVAENSYSEERRSLIVEFAYSDTDNPGVDVEDFYWAWAQERGYTIISRSSEWQYPSDEASATLGAYAVYLSRTGVTKTDTASLVATYLAISNYPSLAFVKAAAIKFAGVEDQIEVSAIPDLIEKMGAFCKAPNWQQRGTRPYADLEQLSNAFVRFLRLYVDEPVLENIEEAIATGMSSLEALERAGQAIRTQAFTEGSRFDAIACMANEYSGYSLVDADEPPSPEQRAIFLAAIERAARKGISTKKATINLANERIAKLQRYEQVIEGKAKRLSTEEMTFEAAMETMRQVAHLERTANDNPGQDPAEFVDAATSYKVALAFAKRFAQVVHGEIVSDFAASLPDIHSLLAAIRSADFPTDLEKEVESRIEVTPGPTFG